MGFNGRSKAFGSSSGTFGESRAGDDGCRGFAPPAALVGYRLTIIPWFWAAVPAAAAGAAASLSAATSGAASGSSAAAFRAATAAAAAAAAAAGYLR